jgi:hypothetical protein
VDDLEMLDFRLQGLRQYARFEQLRGQILKLLADIPQAPLLPVPFRLKTDLVFPVLTFWL